MCDEDKFFGLIVKILNETLKYIIFVFGKKYKCKFFEFFFDFFFFLLFLKAFFFNFYFIFIVPKTFAQYCIPRELSLWR